MKQVKDKYTHTTLEQMPEHKLFRALMSGLNDFGFDCEAFAAGLQYEHPTVQQRFFALLRTCVLFMAEEGNVRIDDRNRASCRMCREIAEQLKDHHLPTQNVKLNHYIAVFERVVLLCKICEQQTSNRIESLAIESGCIRE
ncbi:hypothetical protein [Alistipes putredinis]|uniref:hypothetical protein n=1 Tax=Alistipes putredinis TaxID=28117 RepID=UPI003966D5C1